MNSKVVTIAFLLIGCTGLVSGIFAQNPNFAILPFQRAGKLIYIEARVDGRPGNFIIDTGFGDIFLNSRYFDGMKSDKVLKGVNGQAGKVEINFVDLSLGKIDLPGTYTVVADLSNVERITGIPVLGLIGGDFFMDYELVFDFANSELTFYQLDRKGRKFGFPNLHSAPTDTVSIKLKGHLPCVEAEVGEEILRLAIDSGAESNILNHKSADKVAQYLKSRSEIRIGGFGQKSEYATVGMLIGLKIGGTAYRPMQTVIKSVLQFNKDLAGPSIDGIIGYEFLSQYKTAVNLRKREIYIWDEGKMERDSTPKDVIVKKQ